MVRNHQDLYILKGKFIYSALTLEFPVIRLHQKEVNTGFLILIHKTLTCPASFEKIKGSQIIS